MTDIFAAINYKKTFLKNVVARVDFLTPLLGVDATLPLPLSDLASSEFPILEPRDAYSREVKISAEEVRSTQEHFKEWRFHGKDRTKTLTIAQGCVYVEYTSYRSYEILSEEFDKIIRGINENFPGVKSSRIGLRFVNLIEPNRGSPLDWSAYLAPELLSMFQFPPNEDKPALSRIL